MSFNILPDVIVSTIVLASIYLLLALAWVVVYRATHVLNFAVGQFVALGGFMFFLFSSDFSFPVVVAVLATLVVMALVGAATHLVLMRPLAGEGPFASVAMTLGLAIALSSLIAIVWGTDTRLMPKPWKDRVFTLPGDATVTNYGILSIAAGVLSFLLVLAFFRYTRTGVQVRAAAEHSLLASQRGVNINFVYAAAWALGVVLSTVAALAYSYTTALQLNITELGLRGLAPALVGGLDSIRGAVFGAVLIATVESVAVVYWGGEIKDAAAFVALLVMLAFRPYGLFGTPEIRRV